MIKEKNYISVFDSYEDQILVVKVEK